MAAFKSTFNLLSNSFNPYGHISSRLSTSALLNGKLTTEEKLGIKPKPKRPKSTFLKFISHIKPQLVAEHPKATVPELSRLAGEKWKTVDNKLKLQLQEEYQADWSKYLDEMKAYENSLSPGEKDQIKKANEAMSDHKMKKQQKQRMADLGKPKKPTTIYVRYMMTKLNQRGSTPFKEWQQKLKEEWMNTPESVKASLTESYKKDVEKYKIEFSQWETKMIESGQLPLPLVRRRQK